MLSWGVQGWDRRGRVKAATDTGHAPYRSGADPRLHPPPRPRQYVKASPAPGTVIPAGTKVPLSLKQAISTKTAKEGDAVYAETTFPVAIDSKMIIPPGTYVQGKISQVKRGGHVKGRAELLIHFTSMIYPNGYTVMLPGSLENVPGAEKSTVKNEEGTIQQDSQTGEKIGTAAKTAGAGAAIGGIAGGWKGAGHRRGSRRGRQAQRSACCRAEQMCGWSRNVGRDGDSA